MDVLASLSKLALGAARSEPDRHAPMQAMDLIQRRTGAVSVSIFYGDGGRFASIGLGSELVLSDETLMYLQQRLVQLRVPLAFNLEQDGVTFLTRASNKQRRDYIAWLIPSPESWTELLILRGTWGGSAATPLIDFIDSAMPALAMIIEHHLGTTRQQRLQEQLAAISSSVDTLREIAEVVGSVAAVVPGARELPQEESQLLRMLAGRAESALDAVKSQSELVEAHLRLQEYTLDYTMRLERAVEVERRNATTDALTGLVNHRGALQLLQTECDAAARDQRTLSLLMIDVDGFKLFNDTFGHVTGDSILKVVAEVLRAATQQKGVVCRYGGDEFLVVLPNVGRSIAMETADEIRGRLERAEFRAEGGNAIPISASIGCATFPDDTASPADLVTYADAVMYAAKRQTRAEETYAMPSAGDTSFAVLESLVQAIDAKDRYTKAHCDIVADYAVKLAERMGLPIESRRALRLAGLLHDVGKLVVPDEILKKPAPLTIEEYDVLRRHVTVGEVLIREVPHLTEVLQAVACHHERFDGTGYPRGLRGEGIPTIGRIIAVADSYSAMRLDRPYRKGMGHDRVLNELVAGAGTQFDPDIVRTFVELLLEEQVLHGTERLRQSA